MSEDDKWNGEENEEENGEDEKMKERSGKPRSKHYFTSHIRHLLRDISDYNITADAKTQLNDLAIIVTKLVVQKIHVLVCSRRVLTHDDVERAVNLLFHGSGDLSGKCVQAGHQAVQTFLMNNESKGASRHARASLRIPPSLMERCMRMTIDNHSINSNVPVFLAAVLETFLSFLLQEVVRAVPIPRITVDDVERVVHTEPFLNRFFRRHNIVFVQSCCLVFPKRSFEQKFKAVISQKHGDVRFQKDCFLGVQEYLEVWLHRLLETTQQLSQKARIRAQDLDIACSLVNHF